MILKHTINMSVLQLHFIRSYLAERRGESEASVDQTQVEEDMIIEANR